MNTPSEILQKHEDANEMHLHHIDKKWVIQAMEEYAEQQVKATVKYYNGEPVEEYAKEKSEKPIIPKLLDNVTRLEVIDKQGRVYSQWNCTIELSYQDDGKTLKIFVNN